MLLDHLVYRGANNSEVKGEYQTPLLIHWKCDGVKTNVINTQILTITATTRSWGLASVASVPPGKIHISTPGHKQNALDFGISNPTFIIWLLQMWAIVQLNRQSGYVLSV